MSLGRALRLWKQAEPNQQTNQLGQYEKSRKQIPTPPSPTSCTRFFQNKCIDLHQVWSLPTMGTMVVKVEWWFATPKFGGDLICFWGHDKAMHGSVAPFSLLVVWLHDLWKSLIQAFLCGLFEDASLFALHGRCLALGFSRWLKAGGFSSSTSNLKWVPKLKMVSFLDSKVKRT